MSTDKKPDEHGHNHGPLNPGGLGHSHAPAPNQLTRAFGIGITLNLAFVLIEAYYGWKVNSLALLADAGHNLSDVAGLVLAWGGIMAARLRPDDRHTYGWKRGTIMAAFLNAALLLVAMGSLGWEAVERLSSPQPMDSPTVMVVAGVGIVVNTLTALLFKSGTHDLNVRGAFLHMAADALVSAGVLVAAGLSLMLAWDWLDPVVSLLIAGVIVVSTWGLFKQSVHLLFDGVPAHVDLPAVRQWLLALPDISDVADLHIWAMSTSQVALSAHLVMPQARPDDAFLARVTQQLHDEFDIDHVTLQVVQTPIARPCAPA